MPNRDVIEVAHGEGPRVSRTLIWRKVARAPPRWLVLEPRTTPRPSLVEALRFQFGKRPRSK